MSHPGGFVRGGNPWAGGADGAGDGQGPQPGQPVLVDIGRYASWTVSSAKHGNGVTCLCDGDEKTFWQSDGTQPHIIDLQFSTLVRVQSLGLLLDHTLDESYTPKRVVVRAGYSATDLRDVCTEELDEPKGWVWIPLGNGQPCGVTAAMLVQIAVLENHQNGRDSHIRGVKVLSPEGLSTRAFTTSGFSQHAGLR
eukprot:TRINITY_DN48084_c0_g1_i1.p1 TRINITY_DN48084_c0_g1~~TRINITY_DN48084_c0_g1_i1.p1  ORF type:complete len:195 (+),score=48.96 TRINITY_DN48084_c0_g1_i1:75-659(+)